MKMKMIKTILVTILIILFCFVNVSFSATTEGKKCKAPDYFARNFHEGYHCTYNSFLADIEKGFDGLPFPDTRERAKLFMNVISDNFLKYLNDLPMFLYHSVYYFDMTVDPKQKSVLVMVIINTFSEKIGKPVTLRVWWTIRAVPKVKSIKPIPESRPLPKRAPKKSIEQKSKAGAY